VSLSCGLLGLLKYAPMTGYDLKKVFEESVDFFWSAQTSQIYRELKSLERDGSVVSRMEPSTSGPNRRVYSITEAGLERLRTWLREVSDDTGEDDRNAFLMHVFLSSAVGGEELLHQLRRRLVKYKRDIERLDAVPSTMQKLGGLFDTSKELLFWKIALRRGYHDVESHIRWAEESIALLEAQGYR
jgi:PadR family transcriptional regulator, regulatory protein AphA